MSKIMMDLRKKKRITRKELADIVGVSVDYIAKIEGGFRSPGIQAASRIAEVLGRNVDYIFLRGTGTKSRDKEAI